MALAARISASASPSAAAATARVAAGGRNVAVVSTPKVEDMSATHWASNQNESLIHHDEEYPQDSHQRRRRSLSQNQDFPAFRSYFVNAYTVAEAAGQTQGNTPFALLISEVMRAVGRYEINAQILQGVPPPPGSSVNRWL
ncbi:hypothetical protein [Telmatospirillum sp. J64-1]|uniref:hypothetical protein n=1 Tax=Telmatospirillum sp. J64-1 TaxID=2502183 RepID=UPI00115EFF68|nr:hypothetical protein [Telmatospirillum sp. J64-1]